VSPRKVGQLCRASTTVRRCCTYQPDWYITSPCTPRVVPVAVLSNGLSYRVCYYGTMAQRDKRSVSFPPELAKAIDQAAAESGSSFSAWVAETASHRLRLEAGRQGVAAWEAEHGPLTEQELAEGLARARALLGPSLSKRSA
jgi:hypothetical protein